MEPGIEIGAGVDGLRIAQQRPAVTGILKGLPLNEALARIPALLPICGNAQVIAGRRAAAAARGQSVTADAVDEAILDREQALAAAWRLAVDWPARLGRPADMSRLKAARGAAEAASLADTLLGFLPGLDLVEHDVDLVTWVEEAGCPPAQAVRQALNLEAPLESTAPSALSAGEELVRQARAALGVEDFQPLAPLHTGIEVGPLAMRRHPLIEPMSTSPLCGVLSRRLLAQLLDTLAIADCLQSGEHAASVNGWQETDGVGLGRAMTARGPVFHRVELEPEDYDKVSDWRVLAPTDWHFAPGGPLAREGAALAGDSARLSFLILGFDPCAPWTFAEERLCHA